MIMSVITCEISAPLIASERERKAQWTEVSWEWRSCCLKGWGGRASTAVTVVLGGLGACIHHSLRQTLIFTHTIGLVESQCWCLTQEAGRSALHWGSYSETLGISGGFSDLCISRYRAFRAAVFKHGQQQTPPSFYIIKAVKPGGQRKLTSRMCTDFRMHSTLIQTKQITILNQKPLCFFCYCLSIL